MSDISTPIFTKVVPRPEQMIAVCPECESGHMLSLEEDIDGSYFVPLEDRYIRCNCGYLIEAVHFKIEASHE